KQFAHDCNFTERIKMARIKVTSIIILLICFVYEISAQTTTAAPPICNEIITIICDPNLPPFTSNICCNPGGLLATASPGQPLNCPRNHIQCNISRICVPIQFLCGNTNGNRRRFIAALVVPLVFIALLGLCAFCSIFAGVISSQASRRRRPRMVRVVGVNQPVMSIRPGYPIQPGYPVQPGYPIR
ncbi:hypothetical protein GJ496_006685, partial [Pomphorhynchus laevis]